MGVPHIGPIGNGPLGKTEPPSLTFVDDECDGTLSDAFSNITVQSNGMVKKQKRNDRGIGYLIEVAGGDSFGPKLNRVLIAQVHNDAAKKGLRKGDVVTHVNGKSFHGTADDLIQIIGQVKEDGHDKLNLVVNAEPNVAEVLRIRSIC